MEVQLIVLALCITLTLAVDGNNIFDLIKLNNIVGIRELLARDPQVLNQRGPGGQTPLMNAVLSGQLSAVSALLEAGADVTIGEKDGYTPMVGDNAPLATVVPVRNLLNVRLTDLSVARSRISGQGGDSSGADRSWNSV